MRSYLNKLVHITGGSSGIGLEAARLFSSLGASVVIFARDRKKLDTVLRELEETKISSSQALLTLALDVTDRNAVNAVVNDVVAKLGAPDVLINSTGVFFSDLFENTPGERCDEVMRVNFGGTWNTIAALLPHMKARGGNIVNVASVAGLVGVFGCTAYSASEFAVVGFSEALRNELRRYGITVSVLCPPDTDTPQLSRKSRTTPPETRALSSIARLMKPGEVARAMVRGMELGRFLIVAGGGRPLYHLKRLLPGVAESVMAGSIRKVQRKAAGR